MSWVNPSTWAAGLVKTTAWNDLHSSIAELAPGVVTASQDVVHADGANSLARLGIGSNGQVLRSGSTPAWVSLTDTRNNVVAFSTVEAGIANVESTAGTAWFTLQTGTTGTATTKVLSHGCFWVRFFQGTRNNLDLTLDVSLDGGASWSTDWIRLDMGDLSNTAAQPMLLTHMTTGSSTAEIQTRIRYRTSTTAGKWSINDGIMHTMVFT